MVYYPEVVQYNQRKNHTCKFQVRNVEWSMVILFTNVYRQMGVINKVLNLLIGNGVWYSSDVMLSCGEQSFGGFVRMVMGRVTVLFKLRCKAVKINANCEISSKN